MTAEQAGAVLTIDAIRERLASRAPRNTDTSPEGGEARRERQARGVALSLDAIRRERARRARETGQP